MSRNYVQANTDGKLHPANKPSLSPLNRGFLYGDAIYEVWRTYDGILFAWDEHWQRLERSAAALGFLGANGEWGMANGEKGKSGQNGGATLPGQKEMFKQIKRTVSAFVRKTGRRGELYVRLQIWRGAGTIGLNPLLADQPGYVLLVQELKAPTPEQLARGLKLALAKSLHRNHPATLNPLWKTGNYLNNILCLREAVAAGADEVVMTNLAGEISESSVSNLFFVRDGALHTPPLSAGMLAGITRAAVLGPVARAAGVPAHETVIRPEDLAAYSECFLVSTTKEIFPVNAIDQVAFELGPDTVTAKLQAAFNDYTAEYKKRHRKLRVLPAERRPLTTVSTPP